MQPVRTIECRLVVNPPRGGAWNMAVDEVLARWAAAHAGCVLRFYQWSQPTLSLGYFQPVAERWQHAGSNAAACVRRTSGGGAILHDRELTYCLAVAERHPLATDPETLYGRVHAALVGALAECGVSATIGTCNIKTPAAEQPFLCFQRRASGDVLIGREKIGGSAQWRGLGAILQHGSVILARSKAAPEVAGLEDLTGRRVSASDLIGAWRTALADQLCLTWADQPLSDDESRAVEVLSREKFEASSWTERR